VFAGAPRARFRALESCRQARGGLLCCLVTSSGTSSAANGRAGEEYQVRARYHVRANALLIAAEHLSPENTVCFQVRRQQALRTTRHGGRCCGGYAGCADDHGGGGGVASLAQVGGHVLALPWRVLFACPACISPASHSILGIPLCIPASIYI